MKKYFLFLFCLGNISFAQFKAQSVQPSVVSAITRPTTLSDFQSLIDPSKLIMRQQYSVSYSSFGNQAISLGQYTNSMMYQFNQDLNARFDVTMQHSPYNTLGKIGDGLNGIFLSRAEINYQPLDNFLFKISYQQIPNLMNRDFNRMRSYDPFYNW